MIERIPDLVNADANLVRRGRFLSTTFLIEIGDKGYLVKILEGRVASVTPGPFVTPNYSFALRAPRDEWEMFWPSCRRPATTTSSRCSSAASSRSKATCGRSWRTCFTSRTCWPRRARRPDASEATPSLGRLRQQPALRAQL